MFTIKHIQPNGDQTLVQSERFLVERRSDGFMQYLAFDEDRQSYTATWCGDATPGTLHDNRLYVMNKAGATVAVHGFSLPDFSGRVCAQADPEKVAA